MAGEEGARLCPLKIQEISSCSWFFRLLTSIDFVFFHSFPFHFKLTFCFAFLRLNSGKPSNQTTCIHMYENTLHIWWLMNLHFVVLISAWAKWMSPEHCGSLRHSCLAWSGKSRDERPESSSAQIASGICYLFSPFSVNLSDIQPWNYSYQNYFVDVVDRGHRAFPFYLLCWDSGVRAEVYPMEDLLREIRIEF